MSSGKWKPSPEHNIEIISSGTSFEYRLLVCLLRLSERKCKRSRLLEKFQRSLGRRVNLLKQCIPSESSKIRPIYILEWELMLWISGRRVDNHLRCKKGSTKNMSDDSSYERNTPETFDLLMSRPSKEAFLTFLLETITEELSNLNGCVYYVFIVS